MPISSLSRRISSQVEVLQFPYCPFGASGGVSTHLAVDIIISLDIIVYHSRDVRFRSSSFQVLTDYRIQSDNYYIVRVLSLFISSGCYRSQFWVLTTPCYNSLDRSDSSPLELLPCRLQPPGALTFQNLLPVAPVCFQYHQVFHTVKTRPVSVCWSFSLIFILRLCSLILS